MAHPTTRGVSSVLSPPAPPKYPRESPTISSDTLPPSAPPACGPQASLAGRGHLVGCWQRRAAPQARTNGVTDSPRWSPSLGTPCGPEQSEGFPLWGHIRNGMCPPRQAISEVTGAPTAGPETPGCRSGTPGDSTRTSSEREGDSLFGGGRRPPPSRRAKRSSGWEATVYGAEAGKAFRRSPQQAKQQIMSGDAPGVLLPTLVVVLPDLAAARQFE